MRVGKLGLARLSATLLDAAAIVPPLRATCAHMHENQGRIRAAARLMGADPAPYGRRMRELAAALGAGALPLPTIERSPRRPFDGRVVMALHGSPPHLNNGYAVRTRCLLDGLGAAGVDCVAVTRPNFPHDMAAFRAVPPRTIDEAEGHRWHRLASPAPLWEGPLSDYVQAFADGLARLAAERGATVIHAASNHVCGLAACLAAERVGARAVYELRGLWHWSTINRRPGWGGSETFALHEALERQATLRADRVVVLSEALAAHVRGWGVEPARIACVPNGVDAETFAPTARDEGLRARWGARPETFVVGFVGTFTPYEGLDTLLESIALLRTRGLDIVPVLVGDGEDTERLKRLAAKLGVPAAFPGRVPFGDVPKALAAMDCCPFPRRAEGATLLVPPLKLAEAMACGVPVAVADIPPLTETVIDGETGIVFAQGVKSLAAALAALQRDRATREEMARKARAWVAANRSWDTVTRTLLAAWQD
jgi:glycosyltransferase involved in cell wall biosynthesis